MNSSKVQQMQNELRYRVATREIIDLVGAMRSSILTVSPYFQRNLVWREAHKKDFIETILKGFPFPQIFLARGSINLETMSASQAVVDGQQRLNTISEYVSGRLLVDGKYFPELTDKEKEAFLKYEVAVIDFDLDVDDPKLKDVFHRLNRTYYALSAIEKLASEYSASEFMLVGRTLAGEIIRNIPEDIEIYDDSESDTSNYNVFNRDPGIEDDTWQWMLENAEGSYTNILRTENIFSPFEFDRKILLMFTLNLMCTYLFGYYERNDKVRRYLEERTSQFPEKTKLMAEFNNTAEYIAAMNFPSNSVWWNKANFFTLMAELSRDAKIRKRPPEDASMKLAEFADNMPSEYSLAAREAVSRKPQRELRASYLRELLT